jgi:signal peptidase II
MSEPVPVAPAPPPSPAPAAPEASAARAAFRRRAWFTLICIALAVAALDQVTKRWAHHTLRSAPQGRITVIDDYFVFSYVRNPGAAWGFLARASEQFRHPFFLSISVLAMLFILYIHWKLEPGQRLLLVAISLVMGGAIGNFLDRVRLRYVIDFIELHWRHRYHWPTFNVADVAISVGVGLLVLEMIIGRRRPSPAVGGGGAA